MDLNESNGKLGSDINSSIKSLNIEYEQQELIKVINNILNKNPQIIDEFNRGETVAINKVILELKEQVECNLSEEFIKNLVGEEILTR
ncbi:MAG: hypothetical protein ACRC57_15075 [Sarcina sp.]